MGLFSVGEHTTQSTTTNQTTNQYTDKSANAGGDNSIAAGEGATVNIQNLSEKVANTALDDNSLVAMAALQSGNVSTTGAYNLSRDAINAGLKQTEYTINTLTGLQETAARENQDTRNAAQLAIDSSAGQSSQLNTITSAALAKAQAPEASSVATILKPVLWVLGAVFAIFALTVFGSHKGAHAK